MNGSILIVGSGSGLISALADEALRHDIKTALSMIPGNNDPYHPASGTANEWPAQLKWNPCSPISARSLVLAAENRIGPVGTGIIVCAAAGSTEMRDFSPTGIEFVVNNHIKSYMFLAHELTRSFRARRNGTLAFALLEEQSPGILAAPVFSAFKSFSNSMLAQSNADYQSTLAFSYEEKNIPQINEYAAFILKMLMENKKPDRSGWFKFTKLRGRPSMGLILGSRGDRSVQQDIRL